MCNEEPRFTPIYAFIVRIWWEPGATSSDGGLAWRGTVQGAMEQHKQAFQSLDEMVRLIRCRIGEPEGKRRDELPQE